MRNMRTHAGYTVVELLVVSAILGIVMGASVASFATQGRAYLRADTQTTMDSNLRVGMNMVTESLRNARYGVPATNLSSWIPWVPGLTGNPTIIADGSGAAVVSVASATSRPVATLTGRGYVGDTTLYVSTSDQLSAGAGGLLLIGDSENAVVTNVNGTHVSIDTDPQVNKIQGLTRAYPVGTPVYRVDVVTYRLAPGTSQLLRDDHRGAGPQPAVEGIADLRVVTVTADRQYDVILTARSPRVDPLTGQRLSSSLRSRVTLAN